MVGPDPAGSRGYLVGLFGMTAMVIVLIGAGGILGWRVLQADGEQARRDAALRTARQAADDLATIDYRTAERDVRRLLDVSTEEFAARSGLASPEFVEVAEQTRLVSTGEVTAAGVERSDRRATRVLVAVTASVRDVDVPQGAPRHYRLGVDLVAQDDRWLVSNVEFIL